MAQLRASDHDYVAAFRGGLAPGGVRPDLPTSAIRTARGLRLQCAPADGALLQLAIGRDRIDVVLRDRDVRRLAFARGLLGEIDVRWRPAERIVTNGHAPRSIVVLLRGSMPARGRKQRIAGFRRIAARLPSVAERTLAGERLRSLFDDVTVDALLPRLARKGILVASWSALGGASRVRAALRPLLLEPLDPEGELGRTGAIRFGRKLLTLAPSLVDAPDEVVDRRIREQFLDARERARAERLEALRDAVEGIALLAAAPEDDRRRRDAERVVRRVRALGRGKGGGRELVAVGLRLDEARRALEGLGDVAGAVWPSRLQWGARELVKLSTLAGLARGRADRPDREERMARAVRAVVEETAAVVRETAVRRRGVLAAAASVSEAVLETQGLDRADDAAARLRIAAEEVREVVRDRLLDDGEAGLAAGRSAPSEPAAGSVEVDWMVPLGDGAPDDDLGEPARSIVVCRRVGLAAPEGFVLTAALRDEAVRSGGLPSTFDAVVGAALASLEAAAGAVRDDAAAPLLVDLCPDADGGRAVGFFRLGLTPSVLDGVVARTGDRSGAARLLVELVTDFATRVHGVPREAFEGAAPDGVDDVLARFELFVGSPFPRTLEGQLRPVIEVLLELERLRLAHRLGHAAGARGPGLLVTASALGSGGAESGVGRLRWDEGRAGDVTVRFRPDADAFDDAPPFDADGLHRLAPRIHGQLDIARRLLERTPGERPIGFEFTAEAGRLFVVRFARAAVAPVERADPAEAVEGAETAGSTLEVVEGAAPSTASAPPPRPAEAAKSSLLDDAVVAPVAQGNRITSGVAAGRLVFSAATALHCHRAGVPAILVRDANDERGLGEFPACRGVLFVGELEGERAREVGARAGRPVLGLSPEVELDARAACLRVHGQLLREGDPVTLDADGGRLFLGELAVEEPPEPLV